MSTQNKEAVLDSLSKAKAHLMEALRKGEASQPKSGVSKVALRKLEKICGDVESLQYKINQS